MNKYRAESRKAQKARRQERMCERKAAYETREEAYQKGQESYHCPYCGKWHRSGSVAKLAAMLRRKAG